MRPSLNPASAWVRCGWGNAGDWPAHAAQDGFQLTRVPTVGSVVVYAPGDGYSPFGHCALVRQLGQDGQFLVSEMNYVAWNTVDERWSSSYDLSAFILPPGVGPGGGGPPPPGGGGSGADQIHGAWNKLMDLYNGQAPVLIGRLVNVRDAMDLI